MAKKEICCICGKIIEDDILEGNNPDPLRDEEGNFLSQGENSYCCKHCDNVYVTSYRISEAYGLKDQCELTQKEVLRLRSLWRHK